MTGAQVPDDKQLTITETGVVFYADVPVGKMDGGTLTVNLGWAKIAGLGLRVQGDPDIDRTRSGLVFERQHG